MWKITNNGERNSQDCGKSKFLRVSRDEVTEIIAKEIKRIHNSNVPLAILVQGVDLNVESIIKAVDRIDIKEKEKAKIFSRNARRLFRLT